MDVRYYIDPRTGEPHIYSHAVNEREVKDVLGRPMEDRPGREGSRIAIGQTRGGRYLYVAAGQPGSVFVITAYELGPNALRALRRRRKKKV